jgi:hypothetical protein
MRIRLLEDSDGDGVADRREIVLTGWPLHSNLGPDGRRVSEADPDRGKVQAHRRPDARHDPVRPRGARGAAALPRQRLRTGIQRQLFNAHFNPHRILRHVVERDGPTFRTRDEDFLVSSDPDFHPTAG